MKELPESFSTWSHEECKHQFHYINYGDSGENCYPLTSCDNCGESFIVEERSKNEIICHRLNRDYEGERYDFNTGALIVENG